MASYNATELAKALSDMPSKASRQIRGIMAKHLDQAATRAQSRARAEWGDRRSISTIRARMSASVGRRGGARQVGYLLADGNSAFFAERGHGHVPPRPVLRQSGEEAMRTMLGDIADAAVDL